MTRWFARVSATVLLLLLTLCAPGTLAGNNAGTDVGDGASTNPDEDMRADFHHALLERGLQSVIPVLVGNGVTRFSTFLSLDEEDFAAMPFKRGHRKVLLKWWQSLDHRPDQPDQATVPAAGHTRPAQRAGTASGSGAPESPFVTRAQHGSDPCSGYPSPAATQADWGDAQHAHCVQTYSWDELLHGYKDKNISKSFKMGGLGKLVEEGGYETWLCFKDHFCAVDPTNPWFCFVYHETNQVFTPWGENNQLKLVGPRGCECVQLTVQGQEARKPPAGVNVCKDKKPKSGFDNFDCAEAAVNEQAAADVSSPFIGTKTTAAEPVLTSYWQAGLCPVNVHWHLGAEHRSAGQFDETGTGPADPHDWDGKGRMGLRCKHYNDYQDLFTKEYAWEHCKHMQVGETYEVHWPHSAAGACGTINQYQTPFYDGVFCTDNVLTSPNKQIGVQSQTFTIVNDEAYYYPDLIKGMIVDGQFGDDMVFYTGSTTGDGRSNSICSAYAPITWQVDRKCHMISASSFDKMCADMKAQRDDMSDDLHPHGAREVVSAALTANNMRAGSMSGGRATVP